jgi:hypothetical protein
MDSPPHVVIPFFDELYSMKDFDQSTKSCLTAQESCNSEDARNNISSKTPEDLVVVSNTSQLTNGETSSTIILRLSGRIARTPDRFMFLGEAHKAIPNKLELDPRTYNDETINDVDVWVKAMKNELESMYSNNVWFLVQVPNGIKQIGCKWVYKRKRGVDEKVETFKAKLVGKGFRGNYLFPPWTINFCAKLP